MKLETISKSIATIAVAIMMAILLIVFAPYIEQTPEPVVEVIEPKQSPYVIYIAVCGQLEAAIVTTDPPMSADAYGSAASSEMLALMREAESKGRTLTFNGGLRFCPRSEPI